MTTHRGSPPQLRRLASAKTAGISPPGGPLASPRVEEQFDLLKIRGLAKQLALPVRVVMDEGDRVMQELEKRLEADGAEI